MAESQEFAALKPDLIDAMEQVLSLPRFAAYDLHGDRQYALRLYLWNARLAKAFLFPLQICEVLTRNAVNEALAGIHGPDWILAPPFALNEFSEASHARALERLRRRADRRGLPPPTSDDLVAALTFDFWSNLFRDDYDQLWTGPALATAFPNIAMGEGRKDVQRRAAEVNELRNRIAHHEPIHRQNHGGKLASVLDLIGLRSRQARDFTRLHSTVMAVARVPPTPHSHFPGRPLAQMNLRPPPILARADSLEVALATLHVARPSLALVPAAGVPPFAALTTATATKLVIDRASLAGGMVDLSELTVGDALDAHPIELGEIDLRASSGDALSLFFPPDQTTAKPSALVVWSALRELAGIIVRPDLRL